jgi:thioesterase domain-containing protein/acyl carrier protein
VPQDFLMLPELPLTSNGKVDRKALPEPEVSGDGGRGPRNPLEELLCGLFAEVLGKATVGIDDSFFALGGDSIISIQLMSRIRSAFGAQISNRAIFQAPTVAEMASMLDAGDGGGQSAFDVLLPLRANGDRLPVFCVHPVGALSWMYSGLLRHIPAEYPVYGVQARGIAQDEELPGSVPEMAAEYVDAIQRVQPNGPYHLLGWSLGAIIAHEIAAQLEARGERVAMVANLDQTPGLDTEDGEQAPEVDEQGVLRALLGVAGHDGNLGDGPLEHEAVMAALRTEGSALGSFEPEHVLRMVKVVTNNDRIAREHSPSRIEADVLLFVTTPDPEAGPAKVACRLEQWAPYVGGEIRPETVRCEHGNMLDDGPRTEIGRAVVEFLRTTNES